MEDIVRIVGFLLEVPFHFVLLFTEDNFAVKAERLVLRSHTLEVQVLSLTSLLPHDGFTHWGVAKGKRFCKCGHSDVCVCEHVGLNACVHV